MVKVLGRLDGKDFLEVSNKSFLIPITYLGPIEYYSFLLKYSESTFDKHENFVKQSIRNRCFIHGANGKIMLSIPIVRKNKSKTPIKDIRISHSENWQREHWKTIETTYNNSPFFEYYKDSFQVYFNKKYKFLIDFNLNIQNLILNILDVNFNYSFSKSYQLDHINDLRKYKFSSNKTEKYEQVFMHFNGFIPNLSIIDLLFNIGTETKVYLKNMDI